MCHEPIICEYSSIRTRCTWAAEYYFRLEDGSITALCGDHIFHIWGQEAAQTTKDEFIQYKLVASAHET